MNTLNTDLGRVQMDTEALPVIPKLLERQATQGNISKNLIIKLKKEFVLTEMQITDVVDLATEFSASPRRVLELTQEHSIGIGEVWSLYEIRDCFCLHKIGEKNQQGISLRTIAKFKNVFSNSVDLLNNAGGIYELLIDICEFYNKIYLSKQPDDTLILLFIQDQSKYHAVDPWYLLEMLENIDTVQ